MFIIYREVNRYYDNDVFMVDNPDADRMTCLDSDIVQAQPLKSNPDTYNDYRTPPKSKAHADVPSNNIRSASALANNNVSKFGSQGSLRSAISTTTKEYPASNFSNATGRQLDDDSSLLTKGKYNESISSSTSTDRKTPVPAHRRNLSKLHLIDNAIPQTEV